MAPQRVDVIVLVRFPLLLLFRFWLLLMSTLLALQVFVWEIPSGIEQISRIQLFFNGLLAIFCTEPLRLLVTMKHGSPLTHRELICFQFTVLTGVSIPPVSKP